VWAIEILTVILFGMGWYPCCCSADLCSSCPDGLAPDEIQIVLSNGEGLEANLEGTYIQTLDPVEENLPGQVGCCHWGGRRTLLCSGDVGGFHLWSAYNSTMGFRVFMASGVGIPDLCGPAPWSYNTWAEDLSEGMTCMDMEFTDMTFVSGMGICQSYGPGDNPIQCDMSQV